MHSLEALRVINDMKAIKGTRQRFNEVTGQLLHAESGEISTSRTFWNAGQAKEFCHRHGATFVSAGTK